MHKRDDKWWPDGPHEAGVTSHAHRRIVARVLPVSYRDACRLATHALRHGKIIESRTSLTRKLFGDFIYVFDSNVLVTVYKKREEQS